MWILVLFGAVGVIGGIVILTRPQKTAEHYRKIADEKFKNGAPPGFYSAGGAFVAGIAWLVGGVVFTIIGLLQAG